MFYLLIRITEISMGLLVVILIGILILIIIGICIYDIYHYPPKEWKKQEQIKTIYNYKYKNNLKSTLYKTKLSKDVINIIINKVNSYILSSKLDFTFRYPDNNYGIFVEINPATSSKIIKSIINSNNIIWLSTYNWNKERITLYMKGKGIDFLKLLNYNCILKLDFNIEIRF
jgi:hypothetical protein